MSTPPNTPPAATPAWEEDPFWKEVVSVMTGGKKLRSDAYLQTLSAEDLEDLRRWLFSPLPLSSQRDVVPKWRGGPQDGNPPSTSVLSEIGQAMRQVNMLQNMERQQMIATATKARGLQLGLDGSLLDTVLTVMGEEALKRVAAGMADKTLSSAATALLRREEQKFDQKKFTVALQKKIEAGLDALAEKFKSNPEAMALYQQARELIARETE